MYIHTYIHTYITLTYTLTYMYTDTVIIILLPIILDGSVLVDNKLGCTVFLWWEVSTSLLVNEATKPQDY